MHRIILLFAPLLALVPAPAVAAAEFCDDLWFTRNQIMDRAGYCFGSTLGEAMFDNSDCTGKSVSLTRETQRMVDEILRREKQNDCRVDTGKTTMRFPDLAVRRQLVDLPVRSEFESGCFDWQASAQPLFAGRSDQTPIVGRITPGDNLLWSHDYEEGAFKGGGSWSYVTVTRGEEATDYQSAGWMFFKYDSSLCRQWAG